MDYMTASEKAKEWNISKRRVTTLCKEGRIFGAELKANIWFIPKNASKPIDARRKMIEESNYEKD